MLSIQISGHSVEITTALHDFIYKKFERAQKHFDHITTLHVFLEVNKHVQSAEATVHIPGHEIFAKADSEDMYKAIDLLVDKVVRQLDKHKEQHQHQQQQ